MKMKWILLAAALVSQQSYGFICGLGTCTEQCTSPDSVIGEQPLPTSPDINNGNYVDCVYACIDLKQQFQCEDGTAYPWIPGTGGNLDNPDLASIPVFQKGSFKAYADRGFTPLDRETIKGALEIVWEQLGVLFLNDPMNSEFGKCTAPQQYDRFMAADNWGANFWDVNTYGHANLWREPRLEEKRKIPGYPSIKYDLRIVKLWEPGVLGKAKVGDASVARPVIALNWNNLKGFRMLKSGDQVRDPVYGQPGFWATVIAHEMLHTEGFIHPDVNPEDEVSKQQYLNTFMVFFAECIGKVILPDSYDSNSKLFMKE